MKEIIRSEVKRIAAAALALCCLSALTGCIQPNPDQPSLNIFRQDAVSFLQAGLPMAGDSDSDGIPDTFDPDADGDGLSDSRE